LGRADSLSEITQGLAASEGKLQHLGLPAAPSKSTLAYANQHRPWELCQTIFQHLLGRCQQQAAARRRPSRFKNKLVSLDATVIDLGFGLNACTALPAPRRYTSPHGRGAEGRCLLAQV